MRGWAACLAVALALLITGPATAQQADGSLGVVRSPILSINYDQFFSGSRLGKELVGQLEAERILLDAENKKIEQELEAEEIALTEQRDTMPAEEFREAAKAFDEKVQKIRAERRELAVQLTQQRDALRQRFDAAALPVLTEIVRDAGAAVIIDVRAVVLSIDVIDVTDLAIDRLDRAHSATDVPGGNDGTQQDEPAPSGD